MPERLEPAPPSTRMRRRLERPGQIQIQQPLAIAIISLACLEEDGFLLAVGLVAGLTILGVEAAALRETVAGAEWIRRLRR